MPCYEFHLKNAWRDRYLPAQSATTDDGRQIDTSHCGTLNSVVRTVFTFLRGIPLRECPAMGNSRCRVIHNALHVKVGDTLVRVNTNLLPVDTYEEWLDTPPEMRPPTYGRMQPQPGVSNIPDYIM